MRYECPICGSVLNPKSDQVLICTKEGGIQGICLGCIGKVEDYVYANGGSVSFEEYGYTFTCGE